MRNTRGRDSERGAALVEFALLLPVFVMLVLGLFTGGLSYNRKLTLTNAAREASRYGATLPVSDMEDWLEAVADVARSAATGELDDTDDGQFICVAYVYPEGLGATDSTWALEINEGVATGPTPDTQCFSDGRPNGERRVQVRVGRPGEIELGVFPTIDINLRSNAVMRFERVG